MRKAIRKSANLSVPVRADIAGAFSDLAYYLDKFGIEKGEVTNFSLPILMKISARIDDENGSMVVRLPDLGEEIEGDLNDLEKQESNNISQIIIHFVNLFNLDTSGLIIEVSGGGQIPPASGLGTSSAAGIGVIMCLSNLYGIHGINPCELNYIVELSMGIMGGKQDYYAAWLTGINYLEFSGPQKSLVTVKKHFDIKSKEYQWLQQRSLIYFSGQSRSSGVANAEPERKVKKDPGIIRRIADVASESWIAISDMDKGGFSKAIAKDRENRLDLSDLYYTHEMKNMGRVGDDLGYSHRACGAGMGGCMLFFGEPENHSKLEHELKKIGGWRVV
ncbi:MAG: D-glycero-alpha-D-manno-heptose 7-phosphate kinase [bacterium ADurb.Bin212]|nr:MAG: D-glycero-alpha-D-manno-heptose 7-phosphate kinase [bacterium ADurb.Bin212]